MNKDPFQNQPSTGGNGTGGQMGAPPPQQQNPPAYAQKGVYAQPAPQQQYAPQPQGQPAPQYAQPQAVYNPNMPQQGQYAQQGQQVVVVAPGQGAQGMGGVQTLGGYGQPPPGRANPGWTPGNDQVFCNCFTTVMDGHPSGQNDCCFWLFACFCTACAYGRNEDVARFGWGDARSQGIVCNAACWKYFCMGVLGDFLFGLGPCFRACVATQSRGKLMQYIGAVQDNNFVANWCCHLWCAPCALLQEQRELRRLVYSTVQEGNQDRQNNPQGPPRQTMPSGILPPMIY